MRTLTIKVSDAHFETVKTVIENIKHVKSVETDAPKHYTAQEEHIIAHIKQGFKEAKLIEAGKMKGTSLEDFKKEHDLA